MNPLGIRVTGVAALLLPACGEPPAPRPNVLLVSIDMLRPDHLGCYGYARATSPELDRLASEGALFEQHVSSTSWTLPAHASMFTGLPDSIHGCTDTPHALHERFVTLADRFGAEGYETAGFFSGPYLHPGFGLGQGFHRYVDCTSAAAGAAPHGGPQDAPGAKELLSSHEDVTNPRTFAAFESWFDGRSDRPFFAFVHLWDAHYDFIPPPPYDRMFDPDYAGSRDGRGFATDPSLNASMPKRDLEHVLALYDGEIAWTDSFLGRIRTRLESAGLLDSTVIVVTSDHGTEFFEHGDKGHRKSLYDEVTRIPLVVRYPPAVPAGTRVAKQTRMVDLAPTLLELAGAPKLDATFGASLVTLIRDPSTPFSELALSELDTRTHAMRSVRTTTWKLLEAREKGRPCALDLVRDPGERRTICEPNAPLVDLGRRALEVIDRELALAARAHRGDRAASEAPEAIERQLRDLGYTGDVEPR